MLHFHFLDYSDFFSLASIINQSASLQAKLVIKRNTKQKNANSQQEKGNHTNSARLIQLVSGSNGSVVSLEELVKGDWEPFYGAMYLSLNGVNSENMQEKVSRTSALYNYQYVWRQLMLDSLTSKIKAKCAVESAEIKCLILPNAHDFPKGGKSKLLFTNSFTHTQVANTQKFHMVTLFTYHLM